MQTREIQVHWDILGWQHSFFLHCKYISFWVADVLLPRNVAVLVYQVKKTQSELYLDVDSSSIWTSWLGFCIENRNWMETKEIKYEMCKYSWEYTLAVLIKRYCKSYNLGGSFYKTPFQRKGTSVTMQSRWTRTTVFFLLGTLKINVKINSRECKQGLLIIFSAFYLINNVFYFWTCPILPLHRLIWRHFCFVLFVF